MKTKLLVLFVLFCFGIAGTRAADVYYIDAGGNMQTVNATQITSASTTLAAGWYYVTGMVNTTNLSVSGTVNLILFDASQLTAVGSASNAGIGVATGTTLNIYVQYSRTGQLTATGGDNSAGIGGGNTGHAGTVNIYGGTVTANGGSGGDGGAGIGGGKHGHGGTVSIFDGTVTATGGGTSGYFGGTGIGGGGGGNGGTLTITGGTVTATGSIDYWGTPGIGSGRYGTDAGVVTISGGTIIAIGNGGAAGIGGSAAGNGAVVTITGGTVKATGYTGIGSGAGGSNSGTLTDGNGNNVYLNTLTLQDVNTATAVRTLTITGNFDYTYGTNDVLTDITGKLHVYLPPSETSERIIAVAGNATYHAFYTRTADHNNQSTLSNLCTSGATALYVNSGATGTNNGASWANAFVSLDDALAVAASCGIDSVFVAAGTYKPSIKAGNGTQERDKAFVLAQGVKLYGGFDGTEIPINEAALAARDFTTNATILSGDIGTEGDSNDNCYHVVIVASDSATTTLNGFTITGGNANAENYIIVNSKIIPQNGGAALFDNESSGTYSHIIFDSNQAKFGAIYNYYSSPLFSNVSITNNTATQNGGGMHNRSASPILTYVTISGNSANDNGGGIYNVAASTLKLTNATIEGNSADYGGGIYGAEKSILELTNVTISGNSANYSGGGMYNSNSLARLTKVTISKNTSESNGGGMYNYESTATLTNVIISENMAKINGGGIYGIYDDTEDPIGVYTNCLFYNNQSSDKGGAIFFDDGDEDGIVLNNCTFSGNNATTANLLYYYKDGSGTEPKFINCVIDNPTGILIDGHNVGLDNIVFTNTLTNAPSLGANAGSSANITDADPKFVNAVTNNYRLSPCSPAINAGDNNAIPTGVVPTDLDGNPRIVNSIVDMGAYEYQSVFITPTAFYVKHNATGNSTGVSWTDAYTLLDDALSAAKSCGIDSVFVAAGTYTPSLKAAKTDNQGNPTTDRDRAFVLVEGVKLFGGFAGTETVINGATLAARDFSTNATVLSGIVGTSDTETDTVYHVVIGANIANDGQTIFDGFTITGGNANGSGSIIVNEKNISRDNGGGMHNNNSSPILTNLIINSSSATRGGGLFNEQSSSALTNVLINSNTGQWGGGTHDIQSTIMLTNVTISGNTAPVGGGMYSDNSNATLRNSIVWGNNSGLGDNGGGTFNCTYSLVQGLNPTGEGNLDGNNTANDPRFVSPQAPSTAPTTAGNYRLQDDSPVIDAGNNSFIAGITTDLDGNARIVSSVVDMGAYENQRDHSGINNDLSEKDNGLTLYPNPTSDVLHIRAESPISGIEIYSLAGVLLHTVTDYSAPISMDAFADGMYMVKVRTANGIRTGQIIVRK